MCIFQEPARLATPVEEYAETAAKKVMHESLQDATAARRIIDFEQESLQGKVVHKLVQDTTTRNKTAESDLFENGEREKEEERGLEAEHKDPKTKQISVELDDNSTLVVPPPQPGDAGLVEPVDQYDQVDRGVPPLLGDAGDADPHLPGDAGDAIPPPPPLGDNAGDAGLVMLPPPPAGFTDSPEKEPLLGEVEPPRLHERRVQPSVLFSPNTSAYPPKEEEVVSREVLSSCDIFDPTDQPQLVVCHRDEMPEVLKPALVKNRGELLLQEEERRLQEEKIWREADPRRLQEEERESQEQDRISQEECPLYKGKQEKDKSGEGVSIQREEEEFDPHRSLDVLCEEPQIDQQRQPPLEDISRRRIAEDESRRVVMVEEESKRVAMVEKEESPRRVMVEEDERTMVEEDSSRRGSLLDELREEEEMRLRLLQVALVLYT